MEAEFPRDAHRQANPDRAAYLRHLADIGYVLSDVEQLVIDNAKASDTETDDTDSVADTYDAMAEEVTPADTA